MRPGTRPRAARIAPQGSTATSSWLLFGAGIVENMYAPTLTTIATQSSCSARLAVRQVQATAAEAERGGQQAGQPEGGAYAAERRAPGTTIVPYSMRI